MDRTVVLGRYQNELRSAVLRLKRSSGDPLSKTLARFFWQYRQNTLEQLQPDLLVPVPMHWTRRLVRGTNNPEILANELAKKLGVPAPCRMLYRCRKTLPQAKLLPSERFRNIRGAFSIHSGYHLEGARVLLVDDILTTGATSSEAARVLKQAGAAMVGVAVVARAEGISS